MGTVWELLKLLLCRQKFQCCFDTNGHLKLVKKYAEMFQKSSGTLVTIKNRYMKTGTFC